MTPKENLMRVLSGGNPDWMPACVHIANANNLPGFLPKALLADVRDTDADAIHCLTAPTTGNTTLSEARRMLAGHTAAMIRVDPHLLLHGSGEQIDMSIAKTCEEAGDWHNILMIIPCGRAALGNIRRVIDQVRERGKWK